VLGGGEPVLLDLNDTVVKPNTSRRLPGKGLPHPKEAGRRGDIVVAFDIQVIAPFPVLYWSPLRLLFGCSSRIV